MILFALTSDIKQSTDYADLDSLLYGISNGDKKCLEQLYQVTHTSVYSFALSVLKNNHDAEDVLHDCYVAVWNGAESYVSRGKPMAWIITIAKNLCLQRMRERKKAECTSQEGWELAIPDTDMLTMEDRSILVTCMEQLSDEERQIVMLHAAVGFKHREIARIMELPLSTVLSKYARALKRLKQYLQ